MGEIRVKVKLSNMLDDMLRREGRLKRKRVRSYIADAVVDTGAVRCVIPQHVVEKLGVHIRGERMAEYANGTTEIVGLTDPVIFDIQGRDTTEEAMVLGDEVLIGQTVLEKLDLLADCANRQVIPFPGRPDQPVTKIRRKHEVNLSRSPR